MERTHLTAEEFKGKEYPEVMDLGDSHLGRFNNDRIVRWLRDGTGTTFRIELINKPTGK